MKEKDKRKLRGYKATDKVYFKALIKARKQKTSLAKEIEKFVHAYGMQSVITIECE